MPGPFPLPHSRRASLILILAPPAHELPSVAPNPLTGTHLSRLLAATRLAQRYHDIFPQHPEWLQETFDWQADDAEEAFAGMTETFLARVEEHLFPVMVDVWDVELDNALYYLDQIPIIPQGLEHWYYDQFDDYREPLALLLHIEHCYEQEDGSNTLQEAYPDYDFPVGFNLATTVEQLGQMELPEPFSGLIDAIAMVRCDCENPWMDYSMSDLAEMGSDLPWDDPESVAWLAETWQEARPRLERVWALVDWCNPQQVGPPDGERLHAIVDLLLQAYRTEDRHE
ncbi:MAG: hypothetical protein RRC07_17070 [Anaerolineae bacterium]|nr:hypothetical protein [Anaerolineae bacterium]